MTDATGIAPCPIICITGTDTGVGKTIVTAALAAALSGHGQRVAVVKLVQTGVAPDQPGDLAEVRRLAGDRVATFENVRLTEPLAPDVAARRAGATILPVSEHAAHIGTLARGGDYDVVLVEGTGGILVHLDNAGGNLADVAAALVAGELRVGFILVARETYGTLNHTGLTLEALHQRGLELIGVAIGSQSPDPDIIARTNVEELTTLAGGRLTGTVPAGAAQLDPHEFRARAEGWVWL